MSRFGLLFGLAITVAALIACGPSVSPSPAPSPTPEPSQSSGSTALPTSIDPCRLLTVEQASSLNGVTYRQGIPQPPEAGVAACFWDNASARAGVEVDIAFWSSAADAQAAFEAAIGTTSTPGSAVTPVAGIADAAAIARQVTPQGNGGSGAIFVRQGEVLITVRYDGGTTPTDAALRLAATLVIRALPHVPH